MYELSGINQKLMTDFFKTIALALEKKNWNSLILIAIKKAAHNLYPNVPFFLLRNYLQNTLQTIHQRRERNIHTRDFIDANEAREVYHNTYDNLIEELSKSDAIEDKLNLDLIYYIYRLLKYDQVTLIDGEKYLSSFINLSFWGDEHLKAFEKLEAIEKAKHGDKNIDVATNRGKTVKDRVKFLKSKFEIDIMHPEIDSKEAELQSAVVDAYCESNRMMARGIYYCAEISKDKRKQFEINTIGKLKHNINSDEYIPKAHIYNSWYAYVIGIYKCSSKNTIPLDKALKVARLSSYFLFPYLRNKPNPIISIDTAEKPIRERSFYDGLRLHEFTDNRLKIIRSMEEINDTESFLKTFISTLQFLSKS